MSDINVAILGLGTMGAGMASNLLKGGFSLTVYNRTASKAQTFAARGAHVAVTPLEAVGNASVVISMLADDQASRDAWTGKNGALSGVKPGAILIESSTVSPAWIEELSGLATQHGAELLDAPVTGSRVQAEDGKLSFLVGGSDSALETVTPVLNAMSKEIIHLGAVGSGTEMKLINNFLCGVQVASLAEGLAWIERSGLDPERALTVLKNGAPGSPLLSAISARMVKHDYSVNFLLKLMAKDLLYARQAAATSHVDLKTAKVALSLFETAIAQGYGNDDMSSVIEAVRVQ